SACGMESRWSASRRSGAPQKQFPPHERQQGDWQPGGQYCIDLPSQRRREQQAEVDKAPSSIELHRPETIPAAGRDEVNEWVAECLASDTIRIDVKPWSERKEPRKQDSHSKARAECP